MKIYKETVYISYDSQTNFYNELTKIINNMQSNNCQVEVQYNTCSANGIIIYSALILAYTEE